MATVESPSTKEGDPMFLIRQLWKFHGLFGKFFAIFAPLAMVVAIGSIIYWMIFDP
jgi:hypothetical protein